ncbi:hypothetical protein B4923_05275 [Brenneria roseae subsp. americana]|uniref:Uncharacterized protein n=1 Tax=Brenneria roseae subsp. americana TaxID=1508507 RepID=A0A2U1TY50_9GAMM|nr:TA system toxin CbtA family protein [Brenneria roseae]PWC14320.1 hypothetical protein B4923_05275 [Brenneria roseae subsp. americana]
MSDNSIPAPGVPGNTVLPPVNIWQRLLSHLLEKQSPFITAVDILRARRATGLMQAAKDCEPLS